MYGITDVSTGRSRVSRSRRDSKVESYYEARALDEALGGALSRLKLPLTNGRSGSLLAVLGVAFHWRRLKLTPDQGTAGQFSVSLREIASKRTGEKAKPDHNGQLVQTRGPSDVSAFELHVREWVDQIDGWQSPDDVPAELFFKLWFWNQRDAAGQYLEFVPNLDRANEIGLSEIEIAQKGEDTVAIVEYVDADENARKALFDLFKRNVIDDPDTYEYVAPQ